MIYAYAICEAGAAGPESLGRGLSGARLRTIERGGIGAVFSRHRSLRVRPVPEQVLKHERVVERIMATGPVLPMRFGTAVEREEQLEASLAERRDELRDALDRVTGRVELGLRVIQGPGRATDLHPRNGRDYLLARVSDHRRAGVLERSLHAPLRRLAADSVVRRHSTGAGTLCAAYLVDAHAVAEFRRRAEELAAPHEDARVLVTGPWPPYSFVSGAGR